MGDGSAPRGPRYQPTWPPPSTAPAGWYGDPYGYPARRYFDGARWTHHTVPNAAPAVPHRRLPVVVALGAVAVLVASLLASRVLVDALVDLDWPIAVYVAISVVVGYGPSVWWCWYATGRWGTGHRRADLGVRFRWSDLGWGPLIWLAAIQAQLLVVNLVLLTRIPLTSNTEGIGELRLDRTYVITLLVTAVVAAPIVEELVFRGLVLAGLLSRMAWPLAVIAQGALFGVAHVDPARGAGNVGLVLILTAVGIVLGGAAYLLTRIVPTMIAHAILNAVVMAVVLLT